MIKKPIVGTKFRHFSTDVLSVLLNSKPGHRFGVVCAKMISPFVNIVVVRLGYRKTANFCLSRVSWTVSQPMVPTEHRSFFTTHVPHAVDSGILFPLAVCSNFKQRNVTSSLNSGHSRFLREVLSLTPLIPATALTQLTLRY